MKKTQITLSLILASSFLVAGLASHANANQIKALSADASSFVVTTDLTMLKEIHTDQQKEYLSYNGEYVSIPENLYPDGQNHLSDPNPVILAWNYSVPSGKTVSRYDVIVGKEADLKDGYIITGTSAQSLDVYNSYLGDNYFQIVANFSDGTSDKSEIQKYEVDNVYPRNLKIDGMTNCRDMGGGRILEDGGTIKQGLLYRTSGTNGWGNGRAKVTDTITADGKEVLLNRLGCKTEINVNNGSNNNYVGVENYVAANMWYDGGKHHLYRNAEPLKEVFHALSNPDNYPIFYHCRIGTDRTGLCAIMISGLLGVSENEIYQDYLFSNFGNIQEKRYIGEQAGRDNILNYINDLKTYPGEKFQNKVYNFLLSIGVPATELDSIIDILTEGEKASGNDNYQEVFLPLDFTPDGTEMKDNSNDRTARANPTNYYTLGEYESVSVAFDAKYTGEAKLIAYLGSTDSSSSKTIAESLSATYDGNEVEIDEALTFASVGFGSGDNRTYYSPVMLGTVDVIEGPTDLEIMGLANNLNIGAIAVIPTEKVVIDEKTEPTGEPTSNPSTPSSPSKENKNGCGGSIVAVSSVIALMSLAGASVIIIKRKNDR